MVAKAAKIGNNTAARGDLFMSRTTSEYIFMRNEVYQDVKSV